jgi:hypothetical protein
MFLIESKIQRFITIQKKAKNNSVKNLDSL